MLRVSIIIPAYNSAAFLAEAVSSALEQTCQDFEIIIVDDGSTDDTPKVCSGFPAERVRTVFQENMGSPGARNTGLRLAQGEYIAFLDADDWFLPEKLSAQMQALDRDPDAGLAAGGWITVNERGETIRIDRPWLTFPRINTHLLFYECPLVVHSVLVRRSWLDQVGWFDADLKFVEDWDLWLRLALAGCKMVWTETLVCQRRMHTLNKSRDAARTKAGILAALNKAFSRPLPADIAAEKNRILAHWYLISAAGEYAAEGYESEARADLAMAVRSDPLLLVGSPSPASQLLASFAQNVHVEDAAAYIQRVMDNLPVEAASLRLRKRQMLAAALIQKAFVCNSLGQVDRRSAAILAGLRNDPTWLRNRGVASFAFEAVFGVPLAGAVRRAWLWLTGSKDKRSQ